ncbi:MAG: histidine kinase [Pseudomonadota bacterium]
MQMPLHFFSRDRQFWLYHCSALAAGLVVTMGLAIMWGQMVGYQIAMSIAWVPLYTLAVLGFRWLYQRHGGEHASMGRLIAGAVIYSAVAGAIMATALQSVVLPLFWPAFVSKYAQANIPLDYLDFLMGRVREEGPQNQMFILAWSFIYIGVTASHRVKKTELFNLRLQNNLKEAQLSSLSNQLNPHFLFNSLNNIRFMIHEDAQRADRMITSFSDILRYSLESSRQEKVSLAHEVAIIEKYIAIVETQLEKRLAFEMRIADDLHQALVPPMVLQMLIENAIKHGVEQLQAGGTLTLHATLKDEQLVFDVCNDTPVASATAPAGMGIGLRNIAQRLELLYGGRAALKVVAAPARFSVQLTLPMERTA